MTAERYNERLCTYSISALSLQQGRAVGGRGGRTGCAAVLYAAALQRVRASHLECASRLKGANSVRDTLLPPLARSLWLFA